LKSDDKPVLKDEFEGSGVVEFAGFAGFEGCCGGCGGEIGGMEVD